MANEIFRCTHRVTYAECTVGNHVYYARFLDLLEMARGEFFRSIGTTCLQWQQAGLAFPALECQLHYKGPARYDDLLAIELWITQLQRVRLSFAYRILEPGTQTRPGGGHPSHLRVHRGKTPAPARKPAGKSPWLFTPDSRGGSGPARDATLKPGPLFGVPFVCFECWVGQMMVTDETMTEDWKELMAVARREVEATLRSLPVPLRERARKLPVTYEPWPNDALVEDGIAPDTLGLFVGGEFAEDAHVVLPPQIILFLENIVEMVEGHEDEFRAEIRTTLLHELGHYLGLNEDDLFDRGLD